MIRLIVAIIRAFTRCAMALLLGLAAVGARAQSDDPSPVSTQLWANVTLGKSVSGR